MLEATTIPSASFAHSIFTQHEHTHTLFALLWLPQTQAIIITTNYFLHVVYDCTHAVSAELPTDYDNNNDKYGEDDDEDDN